MMYKRYLIIYLLLLLLSLIPLASNYIFLRNMGELLSLGDIVAVQRKTNAFYGTALHDDTWHYKLKLYEYVKPDVVVIGSSRVMQFREDFFRCSFVNLGGGMNYVEDGYHFVKKMLDSHVPQVCMIGMDFWWFNDLKAKKHPETKKCPKLTKRLTLSKICLPFTWLKDGKVTLGDYVSKRNPFYDCGQSAYIGVRANQTKSGYGPDGSFYNIALVTGNQSDFKDVGFSDTKRRIREGTDRFEYFGKINKRVFERFLSIVDSLESKGVKVVLFIPPVAPTIAEEMGKYGDKYAYMEDLKRELSERGIKYYDFHNPTALNSTDYEFLDGFHGGNLTSAKILSFVADDSIGILKDYLNNEYLTFVLHSYSNIAMIPDERTLGLKEVDFLKLGSKNSVIPKTPYLENSKIVRKDL